MPGDESSSLLTVIAGLKRRRPYQFPQDSGTLDLDLAQAIAILAKRQKPDPSSAPVNPCFPSFTHSTLHFFVRYMSRTLVIHAHPDDTVNFVTSQIKSITQIWTSNHYLTHHGRHLHGDSTLAQCSIQKDSTLQFTTRHPISTDYPRSWHIVTGLVFTINSLADIDNNEELKKQWVLDLIEDFLTMAANYTWGHAEVFILGSAPAALVKLFLHANQGMSLFAASAIRRFISTDSYLLPEHVGLKCIPILLEFCKLLSETAGAKSSLYKDCYGAVAALLKEPGSVWYSRLNAVDVVCDLLPFLRDAADKVMAGLMTERMLVDPAYLADFSSFLSSMQGAVHNCRLGDGPILKIVYCSKHSEYEDWMGSLHEIFIDLVEKVDHCLRKVESVLSKIWPRINKSFWIVKSSILPVLTECSYFTNIFEGTEEFLCSVLLDRRSALNLLLKYASRNADLCWILRHKSLTDSEARRNVALMLFPRYEEDQLREMLIDRSRLLDESFEYIAQVDADLLRGGLLMEFKDEEATGPGVLREWFCLLCRELFSPQNILFLACPNDRRRFFPNPASFVDPLHLQYFSFCGRVIALALMHKVQVGIGFDRVFFLQLAGESVTLEDVQSVDPRLYASCKKILEMDTDLLDSDALGLTFVRETKELGSHMAIELCPRGNTVVVNSTNREKYVDLLIKDSFVTSISEQVAHFRQGFYDIVTSSNANLFFRSLDLEDFNQLLGGIDSDINLTEWKAHTSYSGYEAKNRQIQWFWKIVKSMTGELQRRLLFFWTSIKYLPVDGFAGLNSKLYIYRSLASQESLPTSQTCFYRLCLPEYQSESAMHDCLYLITQEHVSCSFGL